MGEFFGTRVATSLLLIGAVAYSCAPGDSQPIPDAPNIESPFYPTGTSPSPYDYMAIRRAAIADETHTILDAAANVSPGEPMRQFVIGKYCVAYIQFSEERKLALDLALVNLEVRTEGIEVAADQLVEDKKMNDIDSLAQAAFTSCPNIVPDPSKQVGVPG